MIQPEVVSVIPILPRPAASSLSSTEYDNIALQLLHRPTIAGRGQPSHLPAHAFGRFCILSTCYIISEADAHGSAPVLVLDHFNIMGYCVIASPGNIAISAQAQQTPGMCFLQTIHLAS